MTEWKSMNRTLSFSQSRIAATKNVLADGRLTLLLHNLTQSLHLKYTCGKCVVSNSSSLYTLFYSVIYNSVLDSLSDWSASLALSWWSSLSPSLWLRKGRLFFNPKNKTKSPHVSFCPVLHMKLIIAAPSGDISGQWQSAYNGSVACGFQNRPHEAKVLPEDSLGCNLHTAGQVAGTCNSPLCNDSQVYM